MLIKIGFRRGLSNLPFFVSIESFIKEHPEINIELLEFDSPVKQINALLDNEIGISAINGFSSHLIVAKNRASEYYKKIKYFSAAIATKGYCPNAILARNEISENSIKNIEGKTIGIIKSETAEISVKLIAKNNGLDSNSITLTNIDIPLLNKSIVEGKYNFLYVFEPYLTFALHNGYRKLSECPEKMINDPYFAGIAAVNTDFYKNNNALGNLIIDAWNEGIDFIREKPIEAKIKSTNYLDIPKDIIKDCTLYYWYKSNELIKHYDSLKAFCKSLDNFNLLDMKNFNLNKELFLEQ